MLAGQAREIARAWVSAHARDLPGFVGAFQTGSITTLPDDASLPATSDVDVMVVLDGPTPPIKPGKLLHQGVLLEISYLPRDQLQSAEAVLGHYHLAQQFRQPNVILDPTGGLTELQRAVANEFATRRWVVKRCEHAMARSGAYLDAPHETDPFHDQVTSWLFGTGVTTHVLLVAGLKNPTVRLRYVATRELLTAYGQLALYDDLLAMLGCAQLTSTHVTRHLDALADTFDAAGAVIKTPVFFAADISSHARPIAIDGSRDLIERGLHREAIFWIVATYARCLKVLHQDAPAETARHLDNGFRRLLADLGIDSFGDLRRRCEQVKAQLPRVRAVAGAIIEANPDIVE